MFGLSLSPRVLTRFMAGAFSPIQAQGIQLLPYLDDWLLCAHSFRPQGELQQESVGPISVWKMYRHHPKLKTDESHTINPVGGQHLAPSSTFS